MKWIIVISIILVVLLYFNYGKGMEPFYTSFNSFYKNYCPSCGWRSRKSCSKCLNCGFCITAQGTGECVPGDSKGPYFRSDCAAWEYSNAYSYYPYSNLYPVVKLQSSSPYFQYQVNKPYRWVPRQNDQIGTN